MQDKTERFYRCYSNLQKKYLLERGFRYELIAKDISTNVIFYLFVRTEELNKALDSYNPFIG